MVIPMEVGRSKRGLEPDKLMHAEEEDQWDMIHDEILSQLASENLVGAPHQQGEPVPDGSVWWPSVNYEALDPMVKVPARAGTVEQWGKTCADKLPMLYELGVAGRPYESGEVGDVGPYCSRHTPWMDSVAIQSEVSTPGPNVSGHRPCRLFGQNQICGSFGWRWLSEAICKLDVGVKLDGLQVAQMVDVDVRWCIPMAQWYNGTMVQ